MAAQDYDQLFKLLMVGDSNVGKTSILLRYTQAEDQWEETKNTVGVDLKVKYVQHRDQRVKLTIWDTAGQERFRTLTSSYYRGAHGIFLVYDVTDRKTFDNVTEWLKEIDIYSTRDDAIKVLVGNKIDMGDARTVTTQEGKAFAKAHSLMFLECSAKTKDGVSAVFNELIQKMFEKPSLGGQKQKGTITMDDYEDEESQGYCSGLCGGGGY